MPCMYDDGPTVVYRDDPEVNLKLAKYKEDLDKLTHENDVLREAILEVEAKTPGLFKGALIKKIGVSQIKHRKEDLARLEKVFRKSKDAEKLGLVILADPAKPLEPQLGFDPDWY